MEKILFYTLLAVFILSRIFFINTQPVLFDSGEYIHLFSIPNYAAALTQGHFPLHEGYVLLFWPVFQLAQALHLPPVYVVILGQIALSVLTLFCFYSFVKEFAGKKTALLAAILISITPLFWVTNVTIMMEIAYITLFFLSLFFLLQYVGKKPKTYQLHLSLLFFTLMFLTQYITILWAPFWLYIIYLRKKKKLLLCSLWLCGYVVSFFLLNSLFISLMVHMPWERVLMYLTISKTNEFAEVSLNARGFFIILRNFGIPLLRNNTSILVLAGLIGLIQLFRKDKKSFFLALFWIAPAVFANQWWDSLFPGRHALLAGFGVAFAAAYLLRNKRKISFAIIILIFIISFPAVNLLHKEIPYVSEAQFAAALPENSLLLESHFARPQVQDTYKGELLAVNEPGLTREKMKEKIEKYLKEKRPVFVSSAALSEPYGLYTGPYVHVLTLSYLHGFVLQEVISDFTLAPYKTIQAEDNLIMYKIVSDKNSAYPKVQSLRNSYRRLDYFDPLSRIVLLFDSH